MRKIFRRQLSVLVAAAFLAFAFHSLAHASTDLHVDSKCSVCRFATQAHVDQPTSVGLIHQPIERSIAVVLPIVVTECSRFLIPPLRAPPVL